MKNWWNQIKYKLAESLRGCYGTDNFSKFLMVAALIVYFVSLVPKLRILYFVSMLIFFYMFWRTLSKHYIKRQRENEVYLKITAGFRNFFRARKRHWMDRKIYKYFMCPKCHTYNRVPKGHGKIVITCPKCRTEFKRDSGKLR